MPNSISVPSFRAGKLRLRLHIDNAGRPRHRRPHSPRDTSCKGRIPTYGSFHRPERFRGEFRHDEAFETRGGRTVPSSILRHPRSTSLIVFAGVTRSVEYGFIAAGVTVAVLALFQSLGVVMGWIHAL
jgi:hypothetical protein